MFFFICEVHRVTIVAFFFARLLQMEARISAAMTTVAPSVEPQERYLHTQGSGRTVSTRARKLLKFPLQVLLAFDIRCSETFFRVQSEAVQNLYAGYEWMRCGV